MKIRPFRVLVHRDACPAMTVFSIVAGLAGGLSAFRAEWKHAANPIMYVKADGRTPSDFAKSIEPAERRMPKASKRVPMKASYGPNSSFTACRDHFVGARV
jgi:uncharacterized iron-regulated membrane protein